eukprot:TRINITY_DN15144_c0_g1_i1.p1 TRINITY_DN15144_c0_g1~~TRINITY_DN15144_c0_g1_i1.p1  ORF type:complete len:191 (+),score=1.57 TRINITY_DN15144_c0_g1_i1:406-978(+)
MLTNLLHHLHTTHKKRTRDKKCNSNAWLHFENVGYATILTSQVQRLAKLFSTLDPVPILHFRRLPSNSKILKKIHFIIIVLLNIILEMQVYNLVQLMLFLKVVLFQQQQQILYALQQYFFKQQSYTLFSKSYTFSTSKKNVRKVLERQNKMLKQNPFILKQSKNKLINKKLVKKNLIVCQNLKIYFEKII